VPTHHILIVDDEDDIREIAQMSMELGGWTARTAGCGRDAVAAAQRIRPDVILLDVMMPGIDGPQTLSQLRDNAETRDIPVIFLTAKVQTSEQRTLEHLNACGVIAKPFDPMTLAAQVARLLTTPR
jgi:two-component system, OmpR family, alkaline phosphatase synthesis response regulator PhoP